MEAFEVHIKKRVAIIGPIGYPGGLQTHHAELGRFLERDGYEVLSIDVELIAKNFSFNNDNVQRIRIRNKSGIVGKIIKTSDWGRAILKINKFDPYICISSANGYGYGWVAKLIKKSIFKVCTEVTSDFLDADPLRVFMAKNHNATIVQSPGLLKAQREKIGKNHALAVLPCFSQQIPTEFLASKPIANERLRLVFFGRLALNKGLMELLQIISEIAPSERPYLDIWGNGELSIKLLDFIVTNELKESVKLKGAYPSQREYAKLLAKYHGLILPSKYSEGLPLVLLEASSIGLPFLSTNIGAISDCAIDNPDVLIIDPGIVALRIGFRDWIKNLALGRFEPNRLKKWYENNHSRRLQEEIWKNMLANPAAYFNRIL